jgi:multidrug efflux pump subunit AcrB
MPQTDSGDFQLNIKMPIGTSFERTDRAMQQVEAILMKNPNVDTAFRAAART